jgi:nucleoside-diphosphate-sugar epimerase
MTTLVFGGTGFIGRRTIPRLVQRGEQVVVVDINPATANFSEHGDAVRVISGDITNFEDVIKAIMEVKPDRIMNLAYLLGSGEDTPHFTMRLNVMGMDNVFEAARLCGVKRITYASSIAVSGLQTNFGDRMTNEDDAMYGTRQYSKHKMFNEYQASQYNRIYGMNITGIRPPNVTGYDKVRGSTDHVLAIVLPAEGLPVNFPHKQMTKLPLHVDEIAEVFTRVTLADSSAHEVYNAGGTPISLGEIADIVREFIPDAQITFDDEGGIEHSDNFLVDNSRLLTEFELEYAPYRDRVLQMINEVREHHGMPLVQGK